MAPDPADADQRLMEEEIRQIVQEEILSFRKDSQALLISLLIEEKTVEEGMEVEELFDGLDSGNIGLSFE